ncbi:MAG TPA: hypothetical protein VMT61_17060 [Candidatus Binataceae bacterium]|nr:hypothetical protein [Candidatus Binataceae bacterium]
MTCREYTEKFLSAHVDDELVGRERRVADGHVAGCFVCRQHHAENRRLKALISGHLQMAHVPAHTRLRINSAIGRVSESMAGSRYPTDRRFGYAALRSVFASASRTGRMPALLGVVASMVLIALVTTTRGPSPIPVPATPAFDLALAKFDSLAEDFVPNAPAESENSHGAYYAWVMDRDRDGSGDESTDLARTYREAGVPEEVFDFEPAGYGLIGGQVAETTDGRPMSYTMYRGEKGQILSICVRAPEMAAPVGARYWSGTHTFYEYKGHSVALTFYPEGHYISILVAREPVSDLLRDVSHAENSSPNL